MMARRLVFILIAALLLPTQTVAANALLHRDPDLNLTIMADTLYQKLPGKLSEGSYDGNIAANQTTAENWFAGPSSLNLQLHEDRLLSDDGRQEWEGGISLPLWLSGQKNAYQLLADAYAAELPAYQQTLRLEASKWVRETLWQVLLAEAELKQAQQQLETISDLQQTVETRVTQGDLPRNDLLLADRQLLSMQRQVLTAQSHLDFINQRYQFYTYQQFLPAQTDEPLPKQRTIDAQHPQVQLIGQKIQKLHAQQGIAHYAGSSNPSLNVGVKKERDSRGEDYNNSLNFGIEVPLGNTRYNAPAIAQVAEKIGQLQIMRLELIKSLSSTLQQLETQLLQLAAEQAIVATQVETSEAYYLLEKTSYELGEISLYDLLQAQETWQQVVAEQQLIELRIRQTKVNINQTLGVLL